MQCIHCIWFGRTQVKLSKYNKFYNGLAQEAVPECSMMSMHIAKGPLPAFMMMLSNDNIYRVTRPLWEEPTDHEMDSPDKRLWRWALMFSLSCAWRLRKQPRRRWFETPSRSLWRRRNVTDKYMINLSEPLFKMAFEKECTVRDVCGLRLRSSLFTYLWVRNCIPPNDISAIGPWSDGFTQLMAIALSWFCVFFVDLCIFSAFPHGRFMAHWDSNGVILNSLGPSDECMCR